MIEDNEYQAIKNVIHEAELAKNNKGRTNSDNKLNREVLALVGAGIGASISLASLYALGQKGLEKLSLGVINPLSLGIGISALPIVGLSLVGAKLADHINHQVKDSEKAHLIRMAKNDLAILEAEVKSKQINKERAKYLNNLLILLKEALVELA